MKFKNTWISTESNTFDSHEKKPNACKQNDLRLSDVIRYVITITGLCISNWYQFRSGVPKTCLAGPKCRPSGSENIGLRKLIPAFRHPRILPVADEVGAGCFITKTFQKHNSYMLPSSMATNATATQKQNPKPTALTFI